MASGGRYGLAQSIFQLGGNIGSALGPFTAAFIVLAWGQKSIAWYSLAASPPFIILWNVGVWAGTTTRTRLKRCAACRVSRSRSHGQVRKSIAILLVLIFSNTST